MRKRLAVLATLTLMLLAYGAGRAQDRDETVVTVAVGAADHELQEGYFSLGPNATVMAKPGSELFNFLARHRGRKIRIVLTEVPGPGLTRLER